MDILKLIKTRRTIRKYQNKKIPAKTLKKILEAGRWAPSAHNSQSWEFIIIDNKKLKKGLIKELDKMSIKFLTSFKILFKNTLTIINDAPLIILVYNTRFLSNKTFPYGEPYFSVTHISEIQGISAAIQNMHLVASSLGIGMAWLTIPLFANKKINKFMKTKNELIAILTLGLPAKNNGNHCRKNLSEIVKRHVK